jgi:hypothetical protein
LENGEANLKTRDGIDANFLAQEKGQSAQVLTNTTAKSTAVVTDEEIDLKEAEQEFQDGSGDNGSQDDVDCIYEPMDTLAGQEKVNLLGTEQEEGVNSESLGTKIQNIKDAKPVSTKSKPRKLTPKTYRFSGRLATKDSAWQFSPGGNIGGRSAIP